MSITVSVSSALTAAFLIARLAGSAGVRTATVVFIILAPLVEAVAGNLLYAERAGVGNRVRELLIYLIVVYAAFSVMRPGPFLPRFAPSVAQILPVFASGLTWVFSFSVHNSVRGRESLLRAFAGKDADVLRHALVDRQHDMALIVRELKRTRAMIGVVFFLLCVLTIFAATELVPSATLPVSSPGFIFLSITGVVSALCIGALNVFMEEYAANGVGLRVPFRFQRRRLVVGAAIVLLAAVGAFALSRNESLLPLEAIARFLRWFAGLFDRDRPPRIPYAPSVQPPQPSYYDQLLELLGEGTPRVPPLWLRMLAMLLRRLLISVASAAVALLIFGPIFSPAFRAGLKQFRPGAAIRDFTRRFLRQLAILSRWLRSWMRRRKAAEPATAARARHGSSAQVPGWRPSIIKRRQMDRVVAVFSSVARWGETHGLIYRRNLGAREYLREIAEIYPEHFGETQTCARIFWEARYSRHTLSAKEMREYVRSARRITAAG